MMGAGMGNMLEDLFPFEAMMGAYGDHPHPNGDEDDEHYEDDDEEEEEGHPEDEEEDMEVGQYEEEGEDEEVEEEWADDSPEATSPSA